MADDSDWLRNYVVENRDRIADINTRLSVEAALRGQQPEKKDLDALEAKLDRKMNQAVQEMRGELRAEADRQSADLKSSFRVDLKDAMVMLNKSNHDANKETRGKLIRYGFGALAVIGIMTGGTGAVEIFRWFSHLLGWA